MLWNVLPLFRAYEPSSIIMIISFWNFHRFLLFDRCFKFYIQNFVFRNFINEVKWIWLDNFEIFIMVVTLPCSNSSHNSLISSFFFLSDMRLRSVVLNLKLCWRNMKKRWSLRPFFHNRLLILSWSRQIKNSNLSNILLYWLFCLLSLNWLWMSFWILRDLIHKVEKLFFVLSRNLLLNDFLCSFDFIPNIWLSISLFFSLINLKHDWLWMLFSELLFLFYLIDSLIKKHIIRYFWFFYFLLINLSMHFILTL